MRNDADYFMGRRYRTTTTDFSVTGFTPGKGFRLHGLDGSKRWMLPATFHALVRSDAFREVAKPAVVFDRARKLHGAAS